MRAPRILRAALDRAVAAAGLRLATWQLDVVQREAARRAVEPLDLLFGIRAVARFMGLSRNQARALVARGAIPAFTLNGVTCARRSSIVRHLAALERAGWTVGTTGGQRNMEGGRDGDRHEA